MNEVSTLGRSCRHFSPIGFIQERGNECRACAIGHPVRKIVAAATGSEHRILFKLPCRPGPQRAADCPDYDPKTDEDIAEGRAKMKVAMGNAVIMMRAANGWREKMIAAEHGDGWENCPVCGGNETVRTSVALGYNNHMRCHCVSCEAGFIE